MSSGFSDWAQRLFIISEKRSKDVVIGVNRDEVFISNDGVMNFARISDIIYGREQKVNLVDL